MTTPLPHVRGAPSLQRSIDDSAVIGARCVIWAFARILADVRLGDDVSIGGGTEVGRGSQIGDRTRVGANCFLPPDALIGEDVFIGPGVTCTDDRHPRILAPGEHYTAMPPIIERGAAIGAGAVICPGITIGAGARVAAGAIVTRDVPVNGFVRCEPAREREPSESAKAHWLSPA